MTRKEYKQLAKTINQRMVEAERRGSLSESYKNLRKSLEKLGRSRFPENFPGLDITTQTESVFDSKDKKATALAHLASQYKKETRLWGDATGKKTPRMKRSADADVYAETARKVIARIDAMTKQGYGDSDAIKHLRNVLAMNGITGNKPPYMPENLPKSADISELNAAFLRFIKNPITLAKTRRTLLNTISDERLARSDIFDGRSTEERLIFANVILTSVFETLKTSYLESEQVLTIIELTNKSNKAKNKNILPRIVLEIGKEYTRGKYNMSIGTFTRKVLNGEIKNLNLNDLMR